MPLSDQEIFERFERRFAAIERQIPATPPFGLVRRSRKLGMLWAVPVAVALVILAMAGGPFLAGRASVALPSVLGSPSAGTPVPTGQSELDVAVSVQPPVHPTGVIIAPILQDDLHFAARVGTPDGAAVYSWLLPSGLHGQGPTVFLGAGTYRLTVWRFSVVDNADTGARSTGAPEAQCSTSVSLTRSDPTRLIAAFPRYGQQPCSLAPSTSAGTALPSSAITPTQAAQMAMSHTSLSTLVSVAAGPFSDLDAQSNNTGPGFPVKPNDPVWAVRFTGTIGPICGPPLVGPSGTRSQTCQSPRPGYAVVYLDFTTGAFLATEGGT